MLTSLRRRGLFASLLAAASGVALVLGAAVPAAHAAPPSSITEPVSLTIHKYSTPAGEEGNGLEADPPSGSKPVEGVEFTVSKIEGIDLHTQAGWQKAAELSEQLQQNGNYDELKAKATQPIVKKTGTDGQAVFTATDKLEVGLYLVEETSVDGAKIEGKATTVVSSRPFLVTLPMTHPTERNKWNYNVHVYPKNTPIEPTKSVVDAAALTVGSEVTYQVAAAVPQGRPLDSYVIIDVFDPAHLTFTSVKSVTLNEEPVDASLYTVESLDGGMVKVRFTAEGLKKLESVPNASVSVTFATTVKAVAESDGTISNTAYVIPSTEYSEDPNDPGTGGKKPPIPSNPVESHYGKIVINKHNKAGDKLAGAEFQVFNCAHLEGENAASAQPLSVNGTSEFTTGDDGNAVIDGLRFSNFANGQEITAADDNYVEYCLVEKTAPQGYELLPEPIRVVLSSDTVQNGVFTADVENVPSNAGFRLPLTGSNGVIVLLAAGALLLAGGVAITWRKAARR